MNTFLELTLAEIMYVYNLYLMHVHGIPHACTWYTSCMYMVYLMHVHGMPIPHACTWNTSCMYMEYLMHVWNTSCMYMEYLMHVHGIPHACTWYVHGMAFGHNTTSSNMRLEATIY